MYYDRKIKYLDYYERAERVRGGGHAKLEVRDGWLRLELVVTGMHMTDSFARDVFLCAERRENSVGKIEISEGKGIYRQQWNRLENIGGTGIRYEELCGIRIPLGAGREISCRWQTKEGTAGGKAMIRNAEVRTAESGDIGRKAVLEREGREEASDKAEKEAVLQEDSVSTTGRDKSWIAGAQNDMDKDGFAREGRMADLPSKGRKDSPGEGGSDMKGSRNREERDVFDREPGERAESEGTGGIAGGEQKDGSGQRSMKQEQKPVKLLENKWAQLWAIYPHIRPFNDEREYISIGPSDFVLFPESSYKMVNNSFLLHGFYNYKHLLLARVERRGETMYYIGVPGTFFEKEKQVAVMFGFESFECAEEPAQAGDFGYYMMRTGL